MITAVLMAIGTIGATVAAAAEPLTPEWMPLCTLVFGGFMTVLLYAQVVVFVGTAQGVLDLTAGGTVQAAREMTTEDTTARLRELAAGDTAEDTAAYLRELAARRGE